MKSREELTQLYNSLNDSEKFGIQFAMFPVKLSNLSHEEICLLMDIRKENETNDINGDAEEISKRVDCARCYYRQK